MQQSLLSHWVSPHSLTFYAYRRSMNPNTPFLFPFTPSPLLLSSLLPTIDLLLQHDTVHTRLEQRAHQTRLPLQHPQPVQDFCSGPFSERGEDAGELGGAPQRQQSGRGRGKRDRLCSGCRGGGRIRPGLLARGDCMRGVDRRGPECLPSLW